MITETAQPRKTSLVTFLTDREYLSRLTTIAVPIALQNFVMSSLNMVASVMIGQLGETSIAAIGLAGQFFFLLNLSLFGVTSGASMFTAQLWGKRDIPNIRRVLGISLTLSLTIGSFFLFVTAFIPHLGLSVYTQDAAVIQLGSQYLRIFGWSYVFFAVSMAFASVLRSTGEVRLPLLVSAGALGVNILLSYGLIFGNLGFPRLEVRGAAIAALIARILECLAMLLFAYARKTPAAGSLRELFRLDWPFARSVLKPIFPVALNEIFWSLGITTYNIIYARIGTDAIAAMNIASAIDAIAMPLFIGTAHACAILVGNLIGAGEEEKAYHYGGRSLLIAGLLAILMGIVIYLGAPTIIALYKVSPEVIGYAQRVINMIAIFYWLRMSNLILFLGILRSGGDTRFGFWLDAGTIWVVGVPMALLGAFVFHLPVYWVYLMVMSDEFTKWAVTMWRFLSRRWIHNLTHHLS
ncbi:MAG: MATE family efflux transporter [Chloroflexi bacterium]|nr:MATE family efflux transporter [Chloroflexota bacterium]